MNKILLLILILLVAPGVSAKQGHLTLLAVKETESGFIGSTADLYLEIRPGSGRVFLDTFPLTKVDTQISTRFAKEIACDFLNKDCSGYDFIYTIKAESAIVAGPSAGAAAAILATALLADLDLDKSVSITGTINSGGLIGHVGGIKEKVSAGASAGLKKVLIPKGEKIITDNSSEDIVWNVINDTLKILIINRTYPQELDLGLFSQEKGIIVKEVATLNDALYEFTGVKYRDDNANLSVDTKYKEIMKKLSIDLCNRTNKLIHDLEDIPFKGNYSTIKETAFNLSVKGKIAFQDEHYYSAASYCFGSNVKYSHLYLIQKNFSQKDIIKSIAIVKKSIEDMNNAMSKKEIMTITDLESYAAIKERLLDADYHLNQTIENINNTDTALYNLAYASERIHSAVSWYEFFRNLGKTFDLNKDQIKKTCHEKIMEAEERYQYLRLLFPSFLPETKKEINYAYTHLANGEFELCIFKAITAKAQASSILNLIGLEENKTMDMLETKLEIVKKSIIKEDKEGIFPIMAYSYYEYSNSLKETDLYSALLYAEYALEFGNLNMYFRSPKNIRFFPRIDEKFWIFVAGMIFGIIPALFYRKYKPRQDTFASTLLGKKR
ncbi:MAG: S16 family serine protease [Nanoarchaeota archaeon]